VKPITGPAMCRLVESNGWLLQQIKSSHHIYFETRRTQSIIHPVHGNQTLKSGLPNRLARDAGVER